MRLFLLAGLCVVSAAAQPLIFNRGIISPASFMPSTLPGGAIAQGGVFSIYGSGMGPTTAVSTSTLPLGTTLSGVTVTVQQGTTVLNAYPVYVSASYIEGIMPSTTPLGAVTVRVRYNGTLSNAMPITVASSAFAIFTLNETGNGPGAIQNIVSATSFPTNSPTQPATPGQAVVLYGSGLGPVADDVDAPPVGNLPTSVNVFVGGVTANILYSGRTPYYNGIDQINFTVPANAPLGCWVPVYVQTGGTTLSNVTTMAITADGSSCFNTLSPTPPFVTSGSYAGFLGIRVTTHEDIGVVNTVDVLGDYASGFAYNFTAGPFPFHPFFSEPPAGTCTAYTMTGDLLHTTILTGAIPAGAIPLSYGPGFTLSGAGGMQLLQNLVGASYLGGSVTGNFFSSTPFLSSGSYTFSASGGTIGPISVTAGMPQPLTWTNRDSIVTVPRNQPLTVNWTGGSGTPTVVLGFGVDIPTNASTMFACIAPANATSFTIPAVIMSNVPASRANPTQSKGVIYLATAPGSGVDAVINTSGLTSGLAGLHYATGKTVIFQ